MLLDNTPEMRVMDIRLRASKRAGELIAEGQERGEIATPGDFGKSRSARDGQTQTSPRTTSDNGSKPKPKTLDLGGSCRWRQATETCRY